MADTPDFASLQVVVTACIPGMSQEQADAAFDKLMEAAPHKDAD